MSRKNRNKTSSSHTNLNVFQKEKDTFNVKENLKKIKSGNDNFNYETDIIEEKVEQKSTYYGSEVTSNSADNYTTLTENKFEKINEKISSEFSTLNKDFNEHKEKTTEKLNEKLSVTEFRFWAGGFIAGVILIGGIIYTLSYQGLIEDNKELNKIVNEVKNSIQLLNYKIDNNELQKKIEKKR